MTTETASCHAFKRSILHCYWWFSCFIWALSTASVSVATTDDHFYVSISFFFVFVCSSSYFSHPSWMAYRRVVVTCCCRYFFFSFAISFYIIAIVIFFSTVLLAWHIIQHSACTLPFTQNNTNPNHTTLTAYSYWWFCLCVGWCICSVYVQCSFICLLLYLLIFYFFLHFCGRWGSVFSCAPSVRTNFLYKYTKDSNDELSLQHL